MIVTKAIKPKKFESELLSKALEDEAEAISKDILLDFEITTTGWEHEVKFEREISVGPNSVDILVGTDDEIYNYVDKGTKEHWIEPRNASVLKFYSGYVPKTVPNVPTSYPGGPYGHFAYSKGHWVKGIKARNFDKIIGKKWQPIMKRKLQDALTKAVKETGYAI